MKRSMRMMLTGLLALAVIVVFTSMAEAHPRRPGIGKRLEHRGEVLRHRGDDLQRHAFRTGYRSDCLLRKGIRLHRHGRPWAGKQLVRKGLALDRRTDRYARRGFVMKRRGERMERWGDRIQR